MAGVRSKIQKLLQGLELSDSGGVEAALAAAPTGDESLQFEELLAGLFKPRHAEDDQSDATSDIASEPDRDAGRPSNRGTHYLYLERKVLQLMADNKSLALTLEQTVRRKDMHIAELQSHLTTVVHELQERQKEVESTAPILKLRVEEFREQLRDLRISDARFKELKSLPVDSLHVVDEIKMVTYEATAELRRDNERLRLAIAGARETAARAEEQAARLRVENSRVAASMAEKERELQLATENLQARVERLASELEATSVRAELLAAKGQMYDEVAARANRLQEEKNRLQVVEAHHKRMEQQYHELQLFAKEKEHMHEMLVTDKAYLSKQVEFLADAQSRLTAELTARDAKITELQKQKQDLYDRLTQTESQKGRAEEARLQRELSGLQASMTANMERIRVETAEAYEREARLLRELRDSAQEDASRAKVALSQLQDQHEQAQLYSAELQRRLESQIVELQTEAKTRAFELSHLKVVLGEKEGLLARATLQAEMLQDKLSASMARYRALEADISLGHRTQQAVVQSAGLDVSGGSDVRGTAGLSPEHSARLAALRREKAALEGQVAELSASLAASQDALKLASQPHAFLLEQIQAAQAGLKQAELKALAAATALKAKEQEAASACAERDALKSDLDLVLAQRGQLGDLKSLLMRSLGAEGPLAAAAARRPPTASSGGGVGRPATTIVGEGAY